MGVPSLMSLLHQNCKQTSETLSLLDRLIRLGRVLRCLCLSGSGWGNSEFVYRERKRTPGQTMDNSWSRTIWGLFLVQLSLAQIELNITCRYAGVYHVEKNGRYSISRTEAADLCKAFNSTLPTLAQMEQALSIGFETCRYGFIDGHVVIPRKTPRFLCAANNTGVYILPSNMSQYDTYCFNASAPLDKEDCSSVTDIPSIFEGQITIGIVNPDGTRYTKKGEYRTNPEDINPSFNPDDDGSSGSAGERSTTGGSTIIQTTYDDVTPTSFQDHESFPSVTSMDSAIISADLEPNEESEEEREKSPSYSGSGIDDDEDFISTTSASTRATSHETIQDWQPWAHGHPNPEEQPQTTAKVTGNAIVDMNRSDDRAHGENSTQESQPSLVPGEKHEDYDGHSSSTTLDIPSNTTQETAVQQQGWEWFLNHPQPPNEDAEPTAETTDTAPHHSTADPKEGWLEDKGTTHYPPMATAEHNHPQSTSRPHTGLEDGHKHSPAPSPTSLTDGDDGLEYGSLPEDSTTPVEDSFIHFPGKNENTAHSSVTPVTTGLPGVTKPTVSESFIPDNTRVPSDHDDSRAGQPRWPAVTAYSTPVPDGNQGQSEQNPNLKRKPKIPEWLIILSALLALALILAVCIAVNSRRRCGQKKKLVINNGNGAVDDKKTPGLNGDASKSQEMVHLVNKEPFDNQMGQDECMTADETRNLQNVDMKIGV
ncbi:CD44 antigen isoform X12 [Phascolarctos cinereus]|uniref:CD44 antigen n=1 Tax=Phascolarctos cinereus TaxID=38626 RepID=A0A6P5IKY4_PHACI|nr:CD44 antigen isoform X12 [Phascolarctos cinereus]